MEKSGNFNRSQGISLDFDQILCLAVLKYKYAVIISSTVFRVNQKDVASQKQHYTKFVIAQKRKILDVYEIRISISFTL